MTATLKPFGLQPAYSPQGSANPALIAGGVASGYNTNILQYQPVVLNSSGNIEIAAITGDIYGVFMGIMYTDSNGVLQVSNKWIAGTTYTGGSASPTYAIVFNDPDMVFSIQCDGSLAATTSIGAQLDFSNITAGSTTTGLSACTANASTVTTSGQNQLRIVALDPAIGNAWGDAYTIVQVQIAQHQFIANKVAV